MEVAMEPFYLLGAPIFDLDPNKKLQAPLGQLSLCKEVLAESRNLGFVLRNLQVEYLAIIQTLFEMGIAFRVVFAHQKKIDMQVLGACISANIRMVDFGNNFFGPSVVYPRDFCVALPGVFLFNQAVLNITTKQRHGLSVLLSPFGEGGRVLPSKKMLLVCERIITKDTKNRPVQKEDLLEIQKHGITTALFPSPLFGVVDLENSPDNCRVHSNDHIDRVGALLFDQKEELHLVLDPSIHTARWRSPGENPPWDLAGPEETVERLKRVYDPLGIKIHRPRSQRVPYSLNLQQCPDGRVLMTGGDPDVAELIGQIVGDKNVFQTSTPVRYFPTWLFAGIRCLIGDAPLPIFKKF